MKLKSLVFCTSLLALSSAAVADTDFAKVNEALQKNNCLACHAVDNKLVGPSYVEVAEANKGDPANAEKLRNAIKNGIGGVWGPIPMPPNPQVSDDDLTLIVDWLMAGAPH
ncbi:MAG TPA: c-type cytochrome [Candidatus Paenalcaligenes intestinipullorum]|uniref:C-type cytochrome n=1 Tax=Candidatus Paenalcaligenes intestinipullorum TaxID=2838718 RepID=A0A9D2U8A9_9BURK|nr:c-type cytochrome [Candidatus Paenalcaligenes intestinipullorum]